MIQIKIITLQIMKFVPTCIVVANEILRFKAPETALLKEALEPSRRRLPA
jgi:hypothetical protein